MSIKYQSLSIGLIINYLNYRLCVKVGTICPSCNITVIIIVYAVVIDNITYIPTYCVDVFFIKELNSILFITSSDSVTLGKKIFN